MIFLDFIALLIVVQLQGAYCGGQLFGPTWDDFPHELNQHVWSTVLEVHPGVSINDVVQAATAGTLLVVQPGRYCETVFMKSHIAIVAARPGMVEIQAQQNHALVCNGDRGCVVSGLLLYGGGPNQGDSCVHVSGGSDVCLVACELAASQRNGIVVEGKGTAPRFECCRVMWNQRHGIVVDGATCDLIDCVLAENQASGAFVWQGAILRLKGCRLLSNSEAGIFVKSASSTHMLDCEIARNPNGGVGIYDTNTTAQLDSCKVLQNGQGGVYVCEGAAAVMSKCEVAHNQGNGVYIWDKQTTTVLSGCCITLNQGHGVVAYHKCGQAEWSDSNVIGNAKLPECKVDDNCSIQ